MGLSLANPSLSIVLILDPEARFQEKQHTKEPVMLPDKAKKKRERDNRLTSSQISSEGTNDLD